jgi:exopolysaccharide biosynthesis protein
MTNTPPKKKKRRLKAGIRRFSRQSLLVFLTIALTVCVSLYFGILILLKGPSPTFSTLAVTTMMETRRGKAVAHLFFSEDELNQMLAKNAITETTEVTVDADTDFTIPDSEKNNIDVYDVNGSTFTGKMMVVRDPSRITLAVNTEMGSEYTSGFQVEEYVTSQNAVAGINAGGFDDPNGQGDGSIPLGVTIKDAQIVSGKADDWGTLIGFNAHHHLIVGQMTAQQAIDWGIVDAVTFSPVLIVNGAAATITGTGGGLNPRTVIGQKADGSVLLLVIDGRQTTSLGASYDDCIRIMLQYGAINAANLDGGSSTVMVYNGEIINSVVSLYGDRKVPTAWIVK